MDHKQRSILLLLNCMKMTKKVPGRTLSNDARTITLAASAASASVAPGISILLTKTLFTRVFGINFNRFGEPR